MKPRSVVLILLTTGLLAAPGRVAAQFAIDWFSVDGGGGTSSGGGYSIAGTVGQPDAGRMSGGGYTIEGGFWGGVQPLASPRLFVRYVGGNVVISWSPATPGFVLQTSASLSPAQWTTSAGASASPVVAPADGRSRFYRLVSP